jgi:23S rRNA (cytidine1920-2'-O)/16S rRNA (cytidine1409-2'-O)-methyltransferase
LFDDLKTAQGWIMAGKVVVDGRVVTKPGTPVKPSARITLRGVPARFASRGEDRCDGRASNRRASFASIE